LYREREALKKGGTMSKPVYRPEIQAALDNIVDTITCGDGGGDYLRFRFMLEALDKQAIEGDLVAEQVLDVVRKFSKLIDSSRDIELVRKK
jgi:hypothetical protein